MSSGAAFTVSGLDLTLGVSYGWGSDDLRSTLELPEGEGIIGTEPFDGLVEYRRLTYVIGFAFSI